MSSLDNNFLQKIVIFDGVSLNTMSDDMKETRLAYLIKDNVNMIVAYMNVLFKNAVFSLPLMILQNIYFFLKEIGGTICCRCHTYD